MNTSTSTQPASSARRSSLRTCVLALALLLLGAQPSFALSVKTPSASDGTYSTKVRVTWAKSKGASKYKVFRSTTPYWSNRVLVKTVKSGTRAINDTSAVPGVKYYYWVCPVGRSYWYYNTGRYDAGTRGIPVPTPSVYRYYDHVTVSWSAQYGAKSYRVYRSTSPSFSTAWTPYYTTTSTSFSDYGLYDGVTYYYWVCPVGKDFEFYNRCAWTSGWLAY